MTGKKMTQGGFAAVLLGKAHFGIPPVAAVLWVIAAVVLLACLAGIVFLVRELGLVRGWRPSDEMPEIPVDAPIRQMGGRQWPSSGTSSPGP